MGLIPQWHLHEIILIILLIIIITPQRLPKTQMKKGFISSEKTILAYFSRFIHYGRPFGTSIYNIDSHNIAPKCLSPTRERIKGVPEVLEM